MALYITVDLDENKVVLENGIYTELKDDLPISQENIELKRNELYSVGEEGFSSVINGLYTTREAARADYFNKYPELFTIREAEYVLTGEDEIIDEHLADVFDSNDYHIVTINLL